MKRIIRKVGRFGAQFWKYRDLLRLLVTRDIKKKYRRSFLGYVWTVLNPLLIMTVMSVVFSKMFGRNIENFPVYLFCGQLLFNFMNQSTHQAIFSITSNGSLLKKTYMPKYIFTVSRITSGLVDFVLSLAALLIVILVTQATFSWSMPLFPLVIVQLYIFCIGLGLFLAQANVFFRDIQYIYNAVTTAWMYLTPIFYSIESLPAPLAWAITHLNPMYFYVSQFRAMIHQGVLPDAYSVIAGCGAAALMLIFGVFCFVRSQDRMILHI